MEDRGAVICRIREALFSMKDEGYQKFQSKLIPNIESDRVIGVRTPELRKYAKQLGKTEDADIFLAELPHHYYEENNLHGFLLEQIKDYDTCIAAWNRFLPYVDNWATCDMPSPKVFKVHLPELLTQIRCWMKRICRRGTANLISGTRKYGRGRMAPSAVLSATAWGSGTGRCCFLAARTAFTGAF